MILTSRTFSLSLVIEFAYFRGATVFVNSMADSILQIKEVDA
jgi:hypothetical protein